MMAILNSIDMQRFVYLHVKNKFHASLLSRDIGKILQTCYFGYFRQVWPWPPKRWYRLQGNFDAYLHAKNIYISHLFLAKILQSSYFGYFKHAWPPTPKEQFLLVGNFDVYLHFFLEILHFKESSI